MRRNDRVKRRRFLTTALARLLARADEVID